MKLKFYKWFLNVFGYAYIWIEKKMEYPDDNIILGQGISSELYSMNRKQLCKYMDRTIGVKGFYDLQSTSKIRLGCQLLKNFIRLKNTRERMTKLNSKTINKLKQVVPIGQPLNRYSIEKVQKILDKHMREELK